MNQPNPQGGNVFFLILAAVAMFAALAWAFTQGSRTNAGSLTTEQTKLAAQELIAYGQTTADAFQKIRLRGCNENQYDYANTVWKRVNGTDVHLAGHNPSAASGCSLFSATDGKITPTIFPRSYFSNVGPTGTQIEYGSGSVVSASLPNLGNPTSAELFFHVPHLSREVCLKINDVLGVKNPGSEPPSPTNTGFYVVYSNSYRDTDVVSDASGSINGKTAYCLHDPATPGEYRFVSVMLVR